MNRRLFLKGVAGAALAVPFLSSLERPVRAQAASAPRRLVIFYTQNGCLTNRWFPKQEDGPLTAEHLAGTTLAGLAPFVDKLLFPRGLGMYPRGQITVNGVTYFDPHDQGMGSKLTCAPIDSENEHYSLGRSLDHVAAELVNPGTKTPLVLSVGFASSNVKQVLSYKNPREPYTPETNPTNVYSSLSGVFGSGVNNPVTEADYRVLRGKSIIDLVDGHLASLKRAKLSKADQQKLDAWLQLIRETETQVVSAACNAETAAALGISEDDVKAASGRGGGRGGGFGGFDTGTAFTLGGDMMIKLIALTMMCDTNRVIIMQWPGFVTFNFDGMTHEYDHHGLSHRNGSAAVGGECVPGVLDMIAEIDNWYAKRYAKLVETINSITEDDGRTMLDNSAVMWLPELADGNAHNNNNLPIVIAGSAGGYLKTGVSVNVEGGTLGTGDSEASCSGEGGMAGFGGISRGGNVPLNKLYVTLLNAIGSAVPGWTPVTEFGVCDTNKPEEGITKPGELDAIKA
ncbi:MAG: DUF1552 domain-containing protein [Pseudomonadota bacterium]